VLLSQTTRDLVEDALPDGAVLRDLGAHRLKDLQRPERLFQLVPADLAGLSGLPTVFPPLNALDRHMHNLPIQPTMLLGREQEVAGVCALLRQDDVRLVTLTGPGGVGKTRLGLQVAAELSDSFADGVWFVQLSRLTDPALVLPTIAQTLGLHDAGSQPISEVLREYVRTRQVLLLLDNFEQVVGAAPQVAELLAASPDLKVVVTSRVMLHLRGEKEYLVPPLGLPSAAEAQHLQTPERLSQYAAVALFIQRARDAAPHFQVTNATAPAVAEICARLDGLPLAIELAAARVKLLSPPALLQRLERRLPLLTGGARDLEERQQTMRNTLAWSYGLLAPNEQRLVRRLGVFVGGWTLEAAEAVCTAPEGAESLGLEMLEGLSALVDQSLVQQLEGEEGSEPRFGPLQVIREYALEQLEASGEAEALWRAHLTYYLTLAEEVEPWLVGGPRLPDALMRLEHEHDNLRAALEWTRRQREVGLGLRLAGAVARFWLLRGHLSEGREWLDELLALEASGQEAVGQEAAGQVARGVERTTSADGAVPGRVRAKALHGVGELATYQGDFSRAVSLLEQSLTLAREAGEMALAVRVLNRLGFAAVLQDDLGRAITWLEESLALARQLGDPLLISHPLSNLGVVAYQRGDFQQAEAHIAPVVAMDRQTGDLLWLPYDLAVWAAIRRRQGDLPQTFRLLREAFTVLRDVVERGWPLITYAPYQLVGLAEALAVAGRGERAARLLGAGTALREALGMVLGAFDRADIEAAVAPARAALGEEAWAAAFAAGRALTLEEAIAEALDETTER
jgi:predicted ATPase